ncbi:hypothetical protein Chor_014566 [Crotalus horridus]
MKCNMMNRQIEEEEEESDKVIQDLKQKIRIRRQQIRTRYLHPACQDVGSDIRPNLGSATGRPVQLEVDAGSHLQDAPIRNRLTAIGQDLPESLPLLIHLAARWPQQEVTQKPPG